MPVVIVETWTGKTDDQKAKVIMGITRVFVENWDSGGPSPDHYP